MKLDDPIHYLFYDQPRQSITVEQEENRELEETSSNLKYNLADKYYHEKVDEIH
jgi:hypothetical protein